MFIGATTMDEYKKYIEPDAALSRRFQSVFINENLVYFSTNNQQWGISGVPETKYLGLYEFNFSTNTLKEDL